MILYTSLILSSSLNLSFSWYYTTIFAEICFYNQIRDFSSLIEIYGETILFFAENRGIILNIIYKFSVFLSRFSKAVKKNFFRFFSSKKSRIQTPSDACIRNYVIAFILSEASGFHCFSVQTVSSHPVTAVCG